MKNIKAFWEQNKILIIKYDGTIVWQSSKKWGTEWYNVHMIGTL